MVKIELNSIEKLLSSVGSDSFGNIFFDFIKDIIHVDECTAFAFAKSVAPIKLVVESNSIADKKNANFLADEYISGYYKSDPNQPIFEKEIITAVDVIAPADIMDRFFREHFYESIGIKQELLLREVVDGVVFCLSLYRKKDTDDYSKKDITKIEEHSHFLLKMIQIHQKLMTIEKPVISSQYKVDSKPNTSITVREETLTQLTNILLQSPHGLTEREAEICAKIIIGYTTQGIALVCNISPNTVATHRKRAYAKLNISSQNELFMRYMSTACDLQQQVSKTL